MLKRNSITRFQMTTLITEHYHYSERAIRKYQRLGPVWLGAVPVGYTDQVRILVVRLGQKLDDEYLASFPSLQFIVTPTTGLNHIDLPACERRGVRIFSLADCRQAIDGVTSTSELTFGLIIALLRKITQANQDVVDNGCWDRDRFRSRQLSGLTLGLVGLGRIGGHVANYARAFGMRVLAYDPYQSFSRFASLQVERSELLPLLEEVDIISLHATLREDNNHLIGEKQISCMRTNALVINTARGELLDECAAASALKEGRLGGLAADVLAGEHSALPWNDSPLVRLARAGGNVIITPHIGGCTTDAMHITEDCLAEHVLNVLEAAA